MKLIFLLLAIWLCALDGSAQVGQVNGNNFPPTYSVRSVTYSSGGTNITIVATNSCAIITTPATNAYYVVGCSNNPTLCGTYTNDLARFPDGSGCFWYTNTLSVNLVMVVDSSFTCNLVNNFEIKTNGSSVATYFSLTAPILTPWASANYDIWTTNGAGGVHIIGGWGTNYTTNCSGFLVSSVIPFNTNLLWMDPNGNDYNGQRGRPDLPFQHLYNVVTQMVSGDTLFVNPGVYTETLAYNSQLPQNVHIIGPGADTAKIRMTLGNGTSYLYLGDSNTIAGLWLTNYVLQPGKNNSSPNPCTNVIIKDMRITSAGDCIIFGHDGCWNPVVVNCFLDGGSDKLADFTDGTSPGWVTSSTIYVHGGRLTGGLGANGFGWTTGKMRRHISCLSLALTGKDIACYSYGLNSDFWSGTNAAGSWIPSAALGAGTNTIIWNTGGAFLVERDTNGANSSMDLQVWTNSASANAALGAVAADSNLYWSNKIFAAQVAVSNKLGLIVNQSMIIRSNIFPLTAWTDGGAGSYCFYWLSNASLYLICTNSMNLNATTNKLGGL